MKKTLLILAALMAFAAASAAVTQKSGQKAPFTADKNTAVSMKAPMRAPTDAGYDIQFCDEIATWYTLSDKNNQTYRCFLYITPDIATQLAGNQITEITFSAALATEKATRDGSIFVTEDLNAEPVTSTPVKIIDSYSQGGEDYCQTEKLETPYTIKENTGFFFGYTVEKAKKNLMAQDYPVGVDYMPANAFAGYVEIIGSDGESRGIMSLAESVDTNLFLIATTEGDKHDVSNIFEIPGIVIDQFSMPVTKVLEGHVLTVIVENLGSNALTTANYTLDVNGKNAVTTDAAINIDGGSSDAIVLDLPALDPGRGYVNFTLNSINGKEVGKTYSAPYIAIQGEGYDRKFVVEEGTGTWCGWCPRGIVGFEYMSKTYPDRFIGIAAHYNDEMSVPSYDPLWYYIDGFPMCLANRDLFYMADPSADNLEAMYQKWLSQAGAAEVKLATGNAADGEISVTAQTTFAIDDDNADYLLAFIVLEDGLADFQTNYYADGKNGECGGWENMASSQPWEYKHVARDIFDFYGIEESIPAKVKAGETYSYQYGVSLKNVENVNKSAIVAILIDNLSGSILNAAKIEAADYGNETGITDIIGDSNAPVEYYNMQGIRMAGDNMPAGIYISRRGAQASKQIIR